VVGCLRGGSLAEAGPTREDATRPVHPKTVTPNPSKLNTPVIQITAPKCGSHVFVSEAGRGGGGNGTTKAHMRYIEANRTPTSRRDLQERRLAGPRAGTASRPLTSGSLAEAWEGIPPGGGGASERQRGGEMLRRFSWSLRKRTKPRATEAGPRFVAAGSGLSRSRPLIARDPKAALAALERGQATAGSGRGGRARGGVWAVWRVGPRPGGRDRFFKWWRRGRSSASRLPVCHPWGKGRD